ncbi:hypothetical protein EBL85_01860 [Marichromatium sp. AB32]|nr:hypothetical protein EBL85_01860 [Marichromatium sp. AB32]
MRGPRLTLTADARRASAPRSIVRLLFTEVTGGSGYGRQPPAASHQLPVTSYQLPATSHQSPVTNYQRACAFSRSDE